MLAAIDKFVLNDSNNIVAEDSTLTAVVDLNEAKARAESFLDSYNIVNFVTGWNIDKDLAPFSPKAESMVVRIRNRHLVVLTVYPVG